MLVLCLQVSFTNFISSTVVGDPGLWRWNQSSIRKMVEKVVREVSGWSLSAPAYGDGGAGAFRDASCEGAEEHMN